MSLGTLQNEHVIDILKGMLNDAANPSDTVGDVIRSRFNLLINQRGNLCYTVGHQQFMRSTIPPSMYNNQDLHDKLYALMSYHKPVIQQEPIIFLKQYVTTWGENVLIAGSASVLYEYNEHIGNWRIIADNLCNKTSVECIFWEGAQVGDDIFFTNGIGSPFVYSIKTINKTNNEDKKVRVIDDLENIYNIRDVRIALTFNDVVFISNFYENGRYCNNKIRWSNYGNLESWDEADSEFPGEQMFPGEIILNMTKFQSYLLIATNKGFWLGSPTGDISTPIIFSQLYYNEDGSRCLYFPNTMYSTGKEVYYLSIDGMYVMTTDRPEPMFVHEINNGLGRLFNGISREYCYLPVCGFNPYYNALYISYLNINKPYQYNINNETVIIIPEYNFVAYLDCGYNSFSVFDVKYINVSIRDYLLEKVNCANFIDSIDIKEGNPLITNEPVEVQNFYTSLTYSVGGFTFENVFGLGDVTNNTLYKIMANEKTINELCTETCKQTTYFLGVSSNDNSIKEIGNCYSRDEVILKNNIGSIVDNVYIPVEYSVNVYSYVGKIGIGPIRLTERLLKTVINYFIMNISTDYLSINNLNALVEIFESHYPKDMNELNCGIVRRFRKVFNIKCQLERGVIDYQNDSVIPVKGIECPLYISGNYYYVLVSVGGIDNNGLVDANMIGKNFEIPRIVLYYSRKE